MSGFSSFRFVVSEITFALLIVSAVGVPDFRASRVTLYRSSEHTTCCKCEKRWLAKSGLMVRHGDAQDTHNNGGCLRNTPHTMRSATLCAHVQAGSTDSYPGKKSLRHTASNLTLRAGLSKVLVG
ncbi:hypothetical protein BJX64DRAFT_159855 [Aspergillus heterothallicus]